MGVVVRMKERWRRPLPSKCIHICVCTHTDRFGIHQQKRSDELEHLEDEHAHELQYEKR